MFLVEGILNAGVERLRKVCEYSVLKMLKECFVVNVVVGDERKGSLGDGHR